MRNYMRLIITFVLLFSFITQLKAQEVNYSPEYFGPNANPVPEFTEALIPTKTTIFVGGSYWFGGGEISGNFNISVEVPLLPERVSFKVWMTTLEGWSVSQSLYNYRGMTSGKLSGLSSGDIYVQTRISLLREKKYCPAIVLNSTLKTASGTDFHSHRYFDTPGYYFDLEVGKSFFFHNKVFSELRGALDVGFLCWETSGSRQNDAPMYGVSLSFANEWVRWQHSLSGYYGWIGSGDKPLVYRTMFSVTLPWLDIHVKYQYGIMDFPFQGIQLGVQVPIEVLTPKFVKVQNKAE